MILSFALNEKNFDMQPNIRKDPPPFTEPERNSEYVCDDGNELKNS